MCVRRPVRMRSYFLFGIVSCVARRCIGEGRGGLDVHASQRGYV